jgi:hypothetical protein
LLPDKDSFMRLARVRFSHLILTAVVVHTSSVFLTEPWSERPGHGVAYFEPPKSVGTPIDDLARTYTGYGLADRIAGRLRLDTDASLHPIVRELIRRRLAEGS